MGPYPTLWVNFKLKLMILGEDTCSGHLLQVKFNDEMNGEMWSCGARENAGVKQLGPTKAE